MGVQEGKIRGGGGGGGCARVVKNVFFKTFWMIILGFFIHSKDILLCYGIHQMSINTTIFL